MLAEKFLLYLETLQSRPGAVGHPTSVSTARHVPVLLLPQPADARPHVRRAKAE